VAGEKGILFCKFGWQAVVVMIILTGTILIPTSLPAASLKVNLEFDVQYNYSTNLDGVDPKLLEPTKASYINFLVGGGFNYRLRKIELGAKGDVGYTDYLTAQGKVERLSNIPPSDYNYVRAMANGYIRYIGRLLTVDLTDDIIRTRSLADVYGPQTDALTGRFLFTDNVASVQLRIKPSPKTRLLLKYSYETLEFSQPENPALNFSQPANSFENRGYFRGEYDLDTQNTVFVDTQGGQRIFLIHEIAGISQQLADYNFLVGLLGYKHHFNEHSDIEVEGGAQTRHFFHESNINIKDYTIPMGRITYTLTKPERYKFTALGEYGTNAYGQNLFFDYATGQVTLQYFFTRKFNAEVDGTYTRDVFGAVRNDRTNLWKFDRVDNVYLGRAILAWNAIQKRNEPILTLKAGYQHTTRDSNLNGPSDFVTPPPPNPKLWTSYNTTIDYYFAEVDFLPTLLIGH